MALWHGQHCPRVRVADLLTIAETQVPPGRRSRSLRRSGQPAGRQDASSARTSSISRSIAVTRSLTDCTAARAVESMTWRSATAVTRLRQLGQRDLQRVQVRGERLDRRAVVGRRRSLECGDASREIG